MRRAKLSGDTDPCETNYEKNLRQHEVANAELLFQLGASRFDLCLSLGKCRHWCAMRAIVQELQRGRKSRCSAQSVVYAVMQIGRTLVLLLFTSISGCTRSPQHPVLRWGGDAEGGAPFVEADPSDPSKARGFDVEIASMIAHGLGREPVFVQTAWSSLEASVERGDFDVALSGLEDRPQLRERHSVSLPYFEFREGL